MKAQKLCLLICVWSIYFYVSLSTGSVVNVPKIFLHSIPKSCGLSATMHVDTSLEHCQMAKNLHPIGIHGTEIHASNLENTSQQRSIEQSSPKKKVNPFKVIIAGAPAAGKGTQCDVIQSQFGLVHLSTGEILRKAVLESTPVGQIAKPFMDKGQLVPDHIVINLILERIQREDCLTRGWLLDGFPRTEIQAEALKNANIVPDVFLLLDVPNENILVERVTGRRIDPITGKIYHMKFKPPENEEIANRLIQRSDDTEEKIRVRYNDFKSHIDNIQSSYEDKIIHVDGSLSPDEVSKMIIKYLDDAVFSKRENLHSKQTIGNNINKHDDDIESNKSELVKTEKLKTINNSNNLNNFSNQEEEEQDNYNIINKLDDIPSDDNLIISSNSKELVNSLF